MPSLPSARAVATVLVGLAAGACGSDDGPSPRRDSEAADACGPPTLVLGTGATAFAPLADGDPVVVVHGPQGGWHVDVAGQVSGTPQTVSLVVSLTADDTGEALAGHQPIDRIALSGWSADACDGQFSGRRALVDDHPGTDQAFVCGLSGRVATLWAEITDDLTGATAEDQRTVRLTLDPADVGECG